MIPSDQQQSYLARQVASLSLCQLRTPDVMALCRAAAWHNSALRLGVCLPLFLVHDVGLLLTNPGAAFVTGAADLFEQRFGRLAAELRPQLRAYRELLELLRGSEVIERVSAFRLKDDLIAVLLVKIFGDAYQRWPDPAKRVGATELPLEPRVYEEEDPAARLGDFDPRGLMDFLRFLTGGTQPLQVLTCLEQIDIDTVRLLGMLTPLGAHSAGSLEIGGMPPGAAGVQLDLVDLYGVFQSSETADVVQFSLDLLPSILETRRQSGVTRFSADGYASIERRGSLDALILSELAYDEELFERKVIDDELYYYGHEKQEEETRRIHYLLIDASPSMRGLRQVFGRGLALTLARKLSLQGDEVWVRFFDARLHDLLRVTRSGADYATPYLLCFRSDRGRNYARVFRQLQLELARLRREERRQIVVYIITHGQCHIPVETVAALARSAFLYGVFTLPSTEVQLDYLGLLHRYQIVDEKVLTSQKDRRERALEIVEDAGRQKG